MDNIEVIKFYKNDCAPCRIYGRTFIKVVSALDVPHREINIDNQPEEATKYNIKHVPTTVVLRDGKLAQQRVGTLLYRDLEEIILSEVQ